MSNNKFSKKALSNPNNNIEPIGIVEVVKSITSKVGNKFEVHNFETGEKTLCQIDDQGEITEIKKLK